MAITVDSTGSNAGPGTEQSTGSFSFTNTAGNALVISISGFRNRTVSSLTYNGVSLTSLVTSTNSSNHKTFLYGLASPATGSNTVSWTLSGNDAPTFALISFSGAHSSPFGATGTGNDGGSAGTAVSTSITTTANNSYIFDAFYRNGGSNITTVGGSQTEVSDLQDAAYGSEGSSSSYKSFTTAGATTMTSTLSSSRNWTSAAVEIKEAAGTSSTRNSFLMMM
jgi:hypothetical protein